ncbi:glucosyltransferase [Mycena alexandri]|uniref:Glucosyltransferase n=1 Tax=Mycena alexandri TaxID=1745969 RepID=A0AAD6T249_9AGAR|nr:glucosyltransferase [Mycena alexandri]
MGPECKILVWWSSALASMPAHLTDYDFAATADEIYDADEARRQGRSHEEIMQQVAEAWNGSDKLSGVVIKSPGAPGMYDYERVARAVPPASGHRCIESVALPYCRQFYKERGQELFAVGLQAHPLCWSGPAVISNERVKSFLDGAVRHYGAKSVLYISFGSLFFPVATPQHVEALIDTLLELEQPFPFLLALGGRMASLPQELIDRVNATGKGLICDFWVEQRAILQHAALGWFLTHGGFNSMTEALIQGIPLIIWPTSAEQPVNAALLSADPHPVAIELLQVRTGPQLMGPTLRGGLNITGAVQDAAEEFRVTFTDARGARGAVLRENAAKISLALREARVGEASEELIRLAQF